MNIEDMSVEDIASHMKNKYKCVILFALEKESDEQVTVCVRGSGPDVAAGLDSILLVLEQQLDA